MLDCVYSYIVPSTLAPLTFLSSRPLCSTRRKSQQLPIIRGPQARRRVPPTHRGEPSPRNHPTAPANLPALDVGEARARGAVQPRVQEAQPLLPRRDPPAVEQLEDARRGGRAARGPGDGLGGARGDDDEVGSLGRDVGVRAAAGVEVRGDACVGLVGGQPVGHGGVLVGGAAEDLGEAAAARGPGALGGVARRAADGGDPGAGGGEGGGEGRLAVELARGADARVARGDEDGDAARAELREEVARVGGV